MRFETDIKLNITILKILNFLFFLFFISIDKLNNLLFDLQ